MENIEHQAFKAWAVCFSTLCACAAFVCLWQLAEAIGKWWRKRIEFFF